MHGLDFFSAVSAILIGGFFAGAGSGLHVPKPLAIFGGVLILVGILSL
jgi:hypothetical protein